MFSFFLAAALLKSCKFILGVFDPYKYANTDMLKLHGMVYETLMENEENQIRGYVHIVDCTGVNLPYMTLFTPKEAVRIVKNAEVNSTRQIIRSSQQRAFTFKFIGK